MNAPDIYVPFNYDNITERILLGSIPHTVADLVKLKQRSVTHILNVCDVDDAPLLASSPSTPFIYLFNQASDDDLPKPKEWFIRSLNFALPILSHSGAVLLVHCYDGIDRSAATVYAILRAFGMDSYDTSLLIKAHRPISLWRYKSDADNAIQTGEW